MSTIRITLLAAVSAPFTIAFAAPAGPSLQEVVVTATRTPEPIENVIGSATVITREQIEQRQVLSLPELLREETGIDLTSQGGMGKLTALYMRGTRPEHILVLIDGVRVGSVTAGTTPFEYLPLEQIERVEIVRGPRSSLYGSDAIGGVIQIFTRRAGNSASISAGHGWRDTEKYSGGFSSRWGNGWLTASATRLSSDGFNACKGSLSGACFTVEPDDDGYRNSSGMLRTGYDWNGVVDADIGVLYSSGRNEFDGSFSNQTDFREFVPSLHAHAKASDKLDVTLNLGVNHDDQTQRLNERYSSFFNTERRSASLQTDYAVAAHQSITVGADYLNDMIESSTAFDIDSRDNKGVFAQYQWSSNRQHVAASARYDDNEQFGGHTTANLGWKRNIAHSIDFHIGWGSAFRAPSFNDLYYPSFSNRNLQPEESRNAELGLSGHLSDWQWSAIVYQNDVEQLIELDGSFLPANVAQARIRGFEWSDTYTFNHWELTSSYSYTDPRNRVAGPNYDNVLLRRARHSGLVRLSYEQNGLLLTGVIRAQGRRYNNAANSTELGAYVVADLIAEYNFARDWKIQGKLSNALDRDYETVYLYSEAPRTLFVSIQYKPAFLNK